MIFLKHKTMVDHLGDPYEGHVSIDMFANAAGKNGMSNGPHGMAAAMAAAMSGLGQFSVNCSVFTFLSYKTENKYVSIIPKDVL